MWPRTIRLIAVTMILMLCASVASTQQSPDDAAIDQMRSTVKKLEGLVGDSNIPPETRQQLNELLFEKRGELHSLLRQKRDGLRSSLRGGMTVMESNAVTSAIRQLEQQMRQLMQASTSAFSTMEAAAHPQSAGRRANAPAPPSESATEAPNETPSSVVPAPAPLPVAPATTALATTPPATTVAGSPAPPTPAPAPAATPDPGCADPAPGPVSPDVEYQRAIRQTACRIFEAVNNVPGNNPSDAQLDFRTYNFVMALAVARANLPKAAIPELTAQAEDASHAKNLSANDSSSGSTALVAKAGVPAIFGFATEHGGLTRTTDGTSITFTGNPVGLVQSMAGKGFIDSFQTQDDLTKVLRKLSFGLTFDTSRGNQAGTFTGSKQQLSGFSFKYNIVDQRDPRAKRYTKRWLEITNGQASNLAQSLNRFVIDLAAAPSTSPFKVWLVQATQSLTGKTRLSDIENALVAELDELGKVQLPADQKTIIDQVGTDFDAFIEKRNDILDDISNGWIATLDYNNLRPVGTPSLSNFRFLAEKGAYKGSVDFTGNASVTFYNSRPAGPKAQTLRDFRFAGQLDVPIGDVTKTGKFLISLAARYQRLLEDETITGSTVIIPKGDIASFQAKLTIPIRGTAFKIPLSFSYANRTELLKEREIRGNFGFTFDLDSIFAKFNPFTQK